ncbi:unnamed protein product [Rhizophagus irregularis]|nr:unnamed protein product [Rhizophagus irregularis]
MSLSLDDATTSNDPMSIGSSFVNEEISIDSQESTSSSENLSTFSSKRRKRSRPGTISIISMICKIRKVVMFALIL